MTAVDLLLPASSIVTRLASRSAAVTLKRKGHLRADATEVSIDGHDFVVVPIEVDTQKSIAVPAVVGEVVVCAEDGGIAVHLPPVLSVAARGVLGELISLNGTMHLQVQSGEALFFDAPRVGRIGVRFP